MGFGNYLGFLDSGSTAMPQKTCSTHGNVDPNSRASACVFANLKFCGVSTGTNDSPPSSPFTRRTTLNFRKHKMPLSVLPAWQTISHKFTLNYNQHCVQMHRGSGCGEMWGPWPKLWLGLVFCHLFGKPENVFQTRIGPFCKRATEWGSTSVPVSPCPLELNKLKQKHTTATTSTHPLKGPWNFPADFAFIFPARFAHPEITNGKKDKLLALFLRK